MTTTRRSIFGVMFGALVARLLPVRKPAVPELNKSATEVPYVTAYAYREDGHTFYSLSAECWADTGSLRFQRDRIIGDSINIRLPERYWSPRDCSFIQS